MLLHAEGDSMYTIVWRKMRNISKFLNLFDLCLKKKGLEKEIKENKGKSPEHDRKLRELCLRIWQIKTHRSQQKMLRVWKLPAKGRIMMRMDQTDKSKDKPC